MALTITDALNAMNDFGVFSYVIPFLLIFAVVYAVLDKTKILGPNNRIMAVISVAIGLLALQFDIVSVFFSVIFPRFGIGLSIFLVILILLGFFFQDFELETKLSWIGWVTGIGVVIWALSSWDDWTGYSGFGGWFSEYIWALLILGGLIAIIITFSMDPVKRQEARKLREDRIKAKRSG